MLHATQSLWLNLDVSKEKPVIGYGDEGWGTLRDKGYISLVA